MVFQECFTMMSRFFKNVIIFNTSLHYSLFSFRKKLVDEMERYVMPNPIM